MKKKPNPFGGGKGKKAPPFTAKPDPDKKMKPKKKKAKMAGMMEQLASC